jgi:hypothetical protein
VTALRCDIDVNAMHKGIKPWAWKLDFTTLFSGFPSRRNIVSGAPCLRELFNNPDVNGLDMTPGTSARLGNR